MIPKTAQAQPTAIYTWSASQWLAANNNAGQFTGTAITNPDGSEGAQITVNSAHVANPYNYIFIHSAGLQGGHQYTAVVTMSIAAQTTDPSAFYLFARNSAGTQYDISQTWGGLPGATRTIVLPLDLRVLSGTWELYMGINYGGSINLNSVVVYSGLSSDGVHNYTWDQPTLNATPTSNPPAGVTQATGFHSFTLTSPTTTGATITVAGLTADYANAPMSVAQANASAINTAITQLAGAGAGSKLLIPPGTYRVAPTAPFTLQNLTNVTVNGQGSTLIFETLLEGNEAFLLSGNSQMLMENLNLDWDWNVEPIAALAVASNVSGTSCTLTFPASTTSAQMSQYASFNWMTLFGMDPTHLVRNDMSIYSFSGGPQPTRTVTGANTMNVTFPTALPLTNGKSYCVRFLYYDMGAFKIAACSNLQLFEVNIYSMPGMGFFFEDRMKNFELNHCYITRSSTGTANPLTTAADGVHSDESQGNVMVYNCQFTGMGDDAINIHDDCYQYNVETNVSGQPSNLLRLADCYSYQLRFDVNDNAEFYNADFSYLGTNTTPVLAQVTAVATHDSANPPYVDLTLASVPAGLNSQSIVRNAAFDTSNVEIYGTTIQYSNGRGILLSADGATITSNFIRDVYSAPIELETEIVQGLWAEGHGASNILIESNTLQDSNQLGRFDGTYIEADPIIPWGQTSATLHQQVSVINNVFYDCPGPAMTLNNCQNVLATGNSIRLGTMPSYLSVYAGTFMLTNSSEASLGGNTWLNLMASSSLYGVIYDPATTSNVSPDLNALINQY